MDSVERLRELPSRLVTTGLIGLVAGLAALTAGCVAGDIETASIDDGSADQTLPSATATTRPPTDATDASGSGPDDDRTTTTVAPDPLQGLDAELVADGFDQPILVTGAPGTDALFVVEREGVVKVVIDGAVRDEPFLDLTDRLLSSSIEQGLLGLAFHPDHADNGAFFAYWTDPEGDSRLARLTTTDDPLIADPDSEELVLAVDQPEERHNAGNLVFGPDGLLYVSLGDGGSGGAPAQDTTNLLGSILRIDVDGRSEDGPYAIPPGNPFGDEIWVYGLRNPWRFSIDADTERVYIGDVGQERIEEINVVELSDGGANFGWSEMEGDQCFRSGCDPEASVAPVLQYTHDEGCSVTGGRVYRGAAIPEFVGHYFFADWCGELVRSFRLTDRNQVVEQFDWLDELGDLGQVTSFGADADGELLTVNWAGELHRIVPVR